MIRAAQPGEAAALSALARAAKASWGYPDHLLDAWSDALTVAADTVARHPTMVLVAPSLEILGFYQLHMHGASCELEHLWVAPGHMRQGLGRQLLSHARSHAANLGAREIRVEADPHAEPFYLANGAERVGSVPAAVPGDRERVLPVLRLTLDVPVSRETP